MKLLTKQYIDEIYQLLNYVENTGSAYIATGVIPTVNTGVNVTYEYPSADGSSGGICGTYIASGKGTLFVSTNSGTLNSTKLLGSHRGATVGSSANFVTATEYNTKINWLNDGIISVDNGAATTTQGTDAVDATELRIFSRYNVANSTWGNCHAKVKRFQISEKDDIIRDFVGVKRITDDEVGFFDLIHHTFYTNAGSGSFTAGTSRRLTKPHFYKKSQLLGGIYQRLSYIKSSGTQYIDLGVTASQVSSVEITARAVSSPTSAYRLLGARSSTTSNAFIISTTATNNIYFNFGNKNMTSLVDISEKHTYKMWRGDCYVDGVYVGNPESTSATFTTPQNIILFGGYNTSAADSIGLKAWEISECTMWNGNVPSMHLVAAKRTTDNVLGMYDTYNDVFYTNAGTGDFVAGDELRDGYSCITYINEQNRAEDVEYAEATYDSTKSLCQHVATDVTIDWSKDFKIRSTFAKTGNHRSIITGSYSGNYTMNLEVSSGGNPRLYITAVSSPSIPKLDVVLKSGFPLNTPSTVEFSWTASTGAYTFSAKSIDGVYEDSTSGTATTRSGTSGRKFYIFVDPSRSVGTSSDFNGTLKVYKLEFEEAGEVKATFIPKIRNKIPCFKELVSGEYYYNGGAGKLALGRRIREVEYIESSGTQWIDTYLYASANTSVSISVKSLSTGTNYILTTPESTNRIIFAQQASGNYLCFEPRTSTRVSSTIVGTSGFHTVSNQGASFYIDGALIGTGAGTLSGLSDGTMRLFRWQADSSSGIQIKFCRIKESGVLVRDYVPAIDEYKKAFLFDNVTHVIFDNIGTGEFIYYRRVIPVEFLYGAYPNYLSTLGTTFMGYKWEIDCKFLKDNDVLMGAGTGATNYFGVTKSLNYMLHTSSSTYAIDLDASVRRVIYIDHWYDSGADKSYIKMTVDNQTVQRDTSGQANSTTALRLFNIANSAYAGHTWIYGVKCRDRSTDDLRLNLIPAKDETGKGFMFDPDTRQIYDNSYTSGNFICGGYVL